MKIGTPKEAAPGEARVAMTPQSARRLIGLGHECLIETGAGKAAGFADSEFAAAGVTLTDSARAVCDAADVVACVNIPPPEILNDLRAGQTLVSLFWPAQNEALLEQLAKAGVRVLAMDMVPRISRAQKLDVLSSMANIAGYRAVFEAGNEFDRFFAGQVTAAGKVPPANVLVVGAGVAGLAAIGQATALGAETSAFDVRPETAEQIESMGASFVRLDFSDQQQDGALTGGYASPSSPEFMAKQLEKFLELAPRMDIVITTALIPNRPAPKLWTAGMVALMKPGSVIVDLAAERGGNCELTCPGERIVTENGVIIVGYTDLPSRMANQASSLYATNIQHLIADMTPAKDGIIVHDMDDDVIRSVTVASANRVTWPPPPPKVAAIAARPKQQTRQLTEEERRAVEQARWNRATWQQAGLLIAGALLLLIAGIYAPASFMQHLTVFVLACFVGFQVIWGVAHALHTPLMSVTNAISGIIIIGALLQIGSGSMLVVGLSFVSVLVASINIVGGFLVTRRMLAMFRKS